MNSFNASGENAASSNKIIEIPIAEVTPDSVIPPTPKSKKSTGLKIAIAILCTLVLVECGFIIYLLFFNTAPSAPNPEPSPTPTPEVSEEIETDADIGVIDPMNYIDRVSPLTLYPAEFGPFDSPEDSIYPPEYLYQTSKSLSSSEFSPRYILAITMLDMFHDANGVKELYPDGIVPKTDLDAHAKKIFGQNAEVDGIDFAQFCEGLFFKYENGSFIYDDNNPYAGSYGCGGTAIAYYEHKVISASNPTDDTLEISEKAILVDCSAGEEECPIYSADQETLLGKVPFEHEPIDVNGYADQLDTHKYTFKKEGENWIFDKIERIKAQQ
ncbi:MAG: hypothetical protein Q4B29_01055 [Candidatus Saccharibacteria bacterium]|nr:hypothetical protein [Candidatus Saccharibacteria bacterium]